MTDPHVTQADIDAFFHETHPEATHFPDPAREILRFKNRISLLSKSVTGRRFLNPGSRLGYTVMAAKDLGFEAKGIEPYEFFASFARKTYGKEYFEHTTAMQYAADGHQADLIYTHEAFCEQPDLETFTAALSRLIAPGGKIYIEEPDGNSFWLPHKFTKWKFLEPPLNFIYLSGEGMTALLARHDLIIEHKFFTFGPFMRLLVSKNP
jgi:SAM-dependent methyltransferase